MSLIVLESLPRPRVKALLDHFAIIDAALIERLAAKDGLKGALVSIDAVATNAAIAIAWQRTPARALAPVKGGKPGLDACKGKRFALTAKAPCKKAGHKFESM